VCKGLHALKTQKNKKTQRSFELHGIEQNRRLIRLRNALRRERESLHSNQCRTGRYISTSHSPTNKLKSDHESVLIDFHVRSNVRYGTKRHVHTSFRGLGKCSSTPTAPLHQSPEAVTAQRESFGSRGVCFLQSRRFVTLYVLLASMFISLRLHYACTSSVLRHLPSLLDEREGR
jgi:hypothetical protein